jgi:arylsulfatase A-like enzyme
MTAAAIGAPEFRPSWSEAAGLSLRAGMGGGLLLGLAEALRVVFLHLALAAPRHQLVHAVWILIATMQFCIAGSLLLGLACAGCLSRAGWHRPERHPRAFALFLNLPLLNFLVFLVPLNHALPEFNSPKSILGNLAFLVLNLSLYPAGMALAARREAGSSPHRRKPPPGKPGSRFKLLGAVEFVALLGLIFAREAKPLRPGGTPAPAPATSSRPNLVLITVDAFRADRLPCFRPGRTLTPNLDGLAEQSTCFEHAYTQGSHTSASFPALLTSMYADEMGQSPFVMIGEERTTLAEILEPHGYRTAALVGNNPFLQSRFGYGQGFEDYSVALFDPLPGLFERINFSRLGDLLYQALYVGHLYLTGSRGHTKQILDQALVWLGASDRRSFFLWIHLMNLHAPYGGLYLQSYIQFLDPDYQGRFANSYAAQDPAVNASLTPREVRHVRALYDAGLIFADEQIGRLLQFLRRSGGYEQTLIIVTGDHGECLGEHRHFQHDEMWEEVIRVPLLIKLPGQTRARVLSENYRLLDVAPTVLDLLGLPLSAEMQGRSFLDSLRGGPEAGRPVFVTRTNPQADLAAVVLGRSKLIFHPRTGQAQLFNLAADPQEQTDLAESNPRRRDQLRAMLQAHLEQVSRIRRRLAGGKALEPERLSPAERGQLQALGYAEALRPGALVSRETVPSAR